MMAQRGWAGEAWPLAGGRCCRGWAASQSKQGAGQPGVPSFLTAPVRRQRRINWRGGCARAHWVLGGSKRPMINKRTLTGITSIQEDIRPQPPHIWRAIPAPLLQPHHSRPHQLINSLAFCTCLLAASLGKPGSRDISIGIDMRSASIIANTVLLSNTI
ncbi:hypothetical protein BGW36DRAFT_34264 [Talaromyces proteolyticus]|uniref:Uncharacterized protein n=1 Tax=Talaromyces proteolyticus TaxID=1131652 RepID=A0AAD4KNE4_9EURO|nr:uncharacterized protein BGW36DRAFT_34264 [Talaromyces proteolyticus]KAH8693100.1 hypothetical protein BGW36DRAFT_34264 [Talaromyces proteolyticus]